MADEQQRVHVDLTKVPYWPRLEDLLAAYDQTSDPVEARRHAAQKAQTRAFILSLSPVRIVRAT